MAPAMSLQDFLSEKPLPGIPSPTLTNPEMVLPADLEVPSPPSSGNTIEGPPSPSYLRRPDQQNALTTPVRKKEKRGLMSRKMLLLRSRTSSSTNMSQQQAQSQIPRSVPSPSSYASDYNPAYGSSPILMDVGNLAPEQTPEEPRLSLSRSSFNSEDMAGIPSFLAKYELPDGVTTDDEMYDSESPAPQKYGYSVSIEGGLDAQRRQQEEDEHNSAILSRRAEQILANAKKRLNLMEGNLRGARDLVAPLTAANLKRATSLGSAHHVTAIERTRYAPSGNLYDASSPRQPLRRLHAQASSPTMGREYHGHARGMSDTELPERPYTALGNDKVVTRSGRIPIRTSEGSWTPSLRNSRSYDSLGSSGIRHTGRDSPLHARASPDPNLGVLVEDDGSHQSPSVRNSIPPDSQQQDGLGIPRPSSRTEDLREQMSSLKGKISTLKERAREDSLRRQSMQSLRNSSPFNNAVASPPEFFYTQSQSYGSPVRGTNAGVGQVSADNSPARSNSLKKVWDAMGVFTGSRNAFAQRASVAEPVLDYTIAPDEHDLATGQDDDIPETFRSSHKRTPSGTAIVQAATNRYSHHQQRDAHDSPVDNGLNGHAQASPGARNESSYLPHEQSGSYVANGDTQDREESESVYEDAEGELPAAVAHEDRDDAFDYENFFLHSAMGSYRNGRRSSTSDESEASSTETARAPPAGQDEDDEFNPGSGLYPPPTPETPERLRAIERSLHQRSMSNDSISTVATFATADEGNDDGRISKLSWPEPPGTRSNSQPNSRPSTAIKRADRPAADAHSERADSGIGLPNRSNSERVKKMSRNIITSPLMSPTAFVQDPATTAVHALLRSDGRVLGLKDKAVLFGVVESLRMVVHKLQGGQESGHESEVLRRRLDQAKRILDGAFE
ncbi:hypothetical protein LTR86_005785 [Recurvomyces mirabilis]|nr:hypothetical protein LTR86_005785 [Recurvomyces mirabilis]